MPTIAYDFEDASEFSDFVTLEPGKVLFKFQSADGSQKSKSGGKKIVVDLIVAGTEPHNEWAIDGLVRQHWPTEGQGAGRFRDFLAALGYKPKGKGSMKIEKFYGTLFGANVTKTAGERVDEAGNPVYFNDLRSFMSEKQMRALLGFSEDEEEDEEEIEDEEEDEEEDEVEEEDEDDEDEDEEEEDEDEEEDDEEDEDEEDEEELTLDDLKSMNLTELKELAKEYDISTRAPKGKKLTSAIMRKRLEVLWEEAEEEDEDEDPF